MRQGDLFDDYGERPAPQAPDLNRIRTQLSEALQELRDADTFPWSEMDLRVWRNLFRQMPNWLPERERTEFQQAFLEQLDRWGRA